MARRLAETHRQYDKPSDDVLEDILCLRARNVSFRAIAEVLEHFRDVTLTKEQINYACARSGEEPDARKVRARRGVTA